MLRIHFLCDMNEFEITNTNFVSMLNSQFPAKMTQWGKIEKNDKARYLG